jgi:hypothetical protein
VNSGRPQGEAGERERVKQENWSEAERQIASEVKERAFKIWVKQGSPKGAAGAAVRIKNMQEAAEELLKETEDALKRSPLD